MCTFLTASSLRKKKKTVVFVDIFFLDLKNFHLSSQDHSRNQKSHQKSHLHTKFCRNRILAFSGWNIEKNYSKNGGRPPCRIFEICHSCVSMSFCFSSPNFALIRQYAVRYSRKLFSMWRPSAILDFLWRHRIASGNCLPPTSSLRIANRPFRYASPHLWNQLPVSFRQPCTKHPADDVTLSNSPPTYSPLSPSITHSLFQSRLKTHLFHKSFPP